MEARQLSIWNRKQLDFFAPKVKSEEQIQRDLNREKRKAFKEKLLERVVLSEDEITKYNFPLHKKDLVEYFSKHSNNFNPGVPQMLLTTLSQYSNKEQEELFLLDLVVMCKSIKEVFPEGRGYNELRKFREVNGLSFFGDSQYIFMVNYLRSLD